jgi:hypothetical protein
LDAEDSEMDFAKCPYDAGPIESEPYLGDAKLLSCTTCGAAWESHPTWLRRVREPDLDTVRTAQAEREPLGRSREAAEGIWREVRSAISSISRDVDSGDQVP